ncbi:MAG: IS66 family insertion sequence element accessory protein TnpB [Roseburia sp.]|nr:IS66 family insertion sequence element accessory protein TnpB [Roseburia sp.]
MKSQTSLVAQQTRLNQWAEQIRECNNRPQGMTVDDWCLENGITRANYYWRLRKVREALLSVAAPAPTFVELKEPEPAPPVSESMKKEDSFSIVAVVKKSSYSIEITNLASASFLQNLLEAMNHA